MPNKHGQRCWSAQVIREGDARGLIGIWHSRLVTGATFEKPGFYCRGNALRRTGPPLLRKF